MRNVFSADYHATANQAGFEKGIDDACSSKHAGACVGNVKDKSVRKAKVILQSDGRIRFKRVLKIRAIAAGDARANKQIYILGMISGISEAVLNCFLRQIDRELCFSSHTPGF